MSQLNPDWVAAGEKYEYPLESLPNSNWVSAPYEVSYLVCVVVPEAVKKWNRKRKLRWIRRETNVQIRRAHIGALVIDEQAKFSPEMYAASCECSGLLRMS